MNERNIKRCLTFFSYLWLTKIDSVVIQNIPRLSTNITKFYKLLEYNELHNKCTENLHYIK